VLLAASRGRVIPRERIYERVWGYQMAHGDRSVDVFVRKLRRKLEAASPGWRYVHTHFGVGYRFDANEAGDEDEDSPEPSATVSPPEGSL
jgi:DNA-binding response OmpR family regulator